MATRRGLVIASAVTTMAGLLGMGFVAMRLGVMDGGGDDAAGPGASETSRDGDDPGTTSEEGTPGEGVRVGYVTLMNAHSDPLPVGVTVERDGEVVYDETMDLPAGESSDGSASGTSVQVGSWSRRGDYVLTVAPPDGRRRVDLAENVADCAAAFAVVESPASVEVLVNECDG